MAFHGRPRLTGDLDLFVRPDVENGERMIESLRAFGFGSLELSAEDFRADDRVVQLGRAPNRVGILTKLYGVQFADAWSHRVAARLGSAEVWMISRDDLVLNKRATGRTQDIADAEFLERLRDQRG